MNLITDTLDTFVHESGDLIVNLNLDSNMLPHLNVDTYQSFTGDYFVESEVDYRHEEYGTSPDVDGYDVTYDHSKINEGLGKLAADVLMAHTPSDGVIESCEYLSSYSPRYYNFETDSFNADYEINATRLDAWVTETGLSINDYAQEHFRSRDGFLSFIPGRMLDPDTADECHFWLALHAWMNSELDGDEMGMSMHEHVEEVYREAITIELSEDFIKSEVVERLQAVPPSEDPEDWADQLLAEARYDDWLPLYQFHVQQQVIADHHDVVMAAIMTHLNVVAASIKLEVTA